MCKKECCVLLASPFLTLQTGCTLAVAEQVLEFEHRDLHWGNVLVSETAEKNVTFKLCGKEYTVPTQGVRVSTCKTGNVTIPFMTLSYERVNVLLKPLSLVGSVCN